MRIINIKFIVASILSVVALTSCNKDDDPVITGGGETKVDFSGTFVQEDQMGRPAVNTVFVSSESKDDFNVTIPSKQAATFGAMFLTNLEALSPSYNVRTDTNALGLNAVAFSGLLATDVLGVSTEGKTTFFDGTNVLTGRALADDVINVELLLIFGGEDGSENPTLTNDNVDTNDKEFLTTFPYLASPW